MQQESSGTDVVFHVCGLSIAKGSKVLVYVQSDYFQWERDQYSV